MTDLPTGTVTFLLTDIENSTPLWDRNRRVMERMIVRHDELVTQSVEGHGGQVVKSRGEGDSIFSVFRSAAAAVRAACEIQTAIHDEPWPAKTPIQVRVGLNTGEGFVRDGDYQGPPVIRCARVRSAARGG